MRLIQFADRSHGRCLGVVSGDAVQNITDLDPSIASIYMAFRLARSRRIRLRTFLEELLAASPGSKTVPYRELLDAGRVLAPVVDEPGARVLVSGTGLTHLGSVQQRDQMHRAAELDAPKSPSQKMFEIGLQGGKPPQGQRGAAPEWFYKGDGRMLRGPGQALEIPGFAPDGGEEPEMVGVYALDDRGIPCRLGFTQGNEWSDHVTENINYLYLAPSKLRTCAIGPELVTDLAFNDIRGWCRVLREGQELYHSGELLTGEKHMSHSLSNLEDHLFKYSQHRQPGDIHVHFFGTSRLSFGHRKWVYENEDVVEVSFAGLGPSLKNPVLRQEPSDMPVATEIA